MRLNAFRPGHPQHGLGQRQALKLNPERPVLVRLNGWSGSMD
jgi:hypothetical protein